jgi:hypothetical protein
VHPEFADRLLRELVERRVLQPFLTNGEPKTRLLLSPGIAEVVVDSHRPIRIVGLTGDGREISREVPLLVWSPPTIDREPEDEKVKLAAKYVDPRVLYPVEHSVTMSNEAFARLMKAEREGSKPSEVVVGVDPAMSEFERSVVVEAQAEWTSKWNSEYQGVPYSPPLMDVDRLTEADLDRVALTLGITRYPGTGRSDGTEEKDEALRNRVRSAFRTGIR